MKLIIEFDGLEDWDEENGYEKGTLKKWVDDGDFSAIAEILPIYKASDINIED